MGGVLMLKTVPPSPPPFPPKSQEDAESCSSSPLPPPNCAPQMPLTPTSSSPPPSPPPATLHSNHVTHATPDVPAPHPASDVHVLPPPPPPPPPHCLPPPPPPPPPPLPCLPPPPGPLNTSNRRSMKKLNWDTIPSQKVLGKLNVWTCQRPQRDLVLDVQSMDELFSHIDKSSALRSSKVMGLKNFEGTTIFQQEPQVTILDSKRSMNIGILLRHFKRPVAEVLEDISKGNSLRFGTDKLNELCKLLPEEREVKQLLSFSGNVSLLSEADQFMVQLVKVPGYEDCLKMMALREEFFPFMEEVKTSAGVMTKAANELLDCVDLHSVIWLVLKAGNYMNTGGYSDNVIGFRMTSLLKLADTKANKPGMNLMHFVAKQAEDIDKDLLMFPSKLEHIEMASRICKEEVISEFQRQVKKISEVKLSASRHSGLSQQLESFLMSAEPTLADIESCIQELNAESHAVAEYFCEDPDTFKLEECCSIFHSFCKRFDKAVKENKEREAAEQRHIKKENMNVALKRRSTSSLPGTMPDQDNSSLESVLHSFLSNDPERLGRCRRNMLPQTVASPCQPGSQNSPTVKKTEADEQQRLEEKQPKDQKENEQEEPLEKDKAQKVLHCKSSKTSLEEDEALVTPPLSERVEDMPITPSTPQPRSRDYFANNGIVDSPWTILSPCTCSGRYRYRMISRFSGNDLYDGDWESDGDGHLHSSSHGGTLTSSDGSASRDKCPMKRVLFQGPVPRSVSMDETIQSPSSCFQLGSLFKKGSFQRIRSYSSGSKTESMRREGTESCSENQLDGQEMNTGFLSFFKRIGGRSKL
ncbi:FH2 domain containing 3 [Thalassophryne amazonica]|uniref:FH2 domain containing 3 n=1 Tax=Thalassophryne amazonica TaxID=390379 RepID=UPI00147163E3|nr:FH2 domain containing 3 [Thalassophryne amazonica]